ncbi:hypothetical protein [Microcystis aeruginosa]|uniref:Uncharacterized protein n=1 Tax=Microcystis aeruginosa FD4 TaxID=2686288 RepID=A0A857D123_MICAE|nr:hypothetical protein [Microcystis aeruginosa]QGZ89334.1 hypothetical protein GQR42_06850 [Microcystis aeruginosa FD4]
MVNQRTGLSKSNLMEHSRQFHRDIVYNLLKHQEELFPIIHQEFLPLFQQLPAK